MGITKEMLIAEADLHQAKAEQHQYAAKVLRDAAVFFDGAAQAGGRAGGRAGEKHPRPSVPARAVTPASIAAAGGGASSTENAAHGRPTCAFCPKTLRQSTPCPDCGKRTCKAHKNAYKGGRCIECAPAVPEQKRGPKPKERPVADLSAARERAQADLAAKRRPPVPEPPKPKLSKAAQKIEGETCEGCLTRMADGGKCLACDKRLCAQCEKKFGGCQECHDAGALA